MTAKIKIRESYYCNLKFLLLFMVVFGHWVEPYINYFVWVKSVYRIIYTVHMPLFIFLSGTFLKSPMQAKRQALRFLAYYLIFQTIAVLTGRALGYSFCLCCPYWHLWYLLSLSLWSLFVWILEKWGHLSSKPLYFKVGIILLAVGIGCGAGCLPWINRNISLSRTLVFFPYMLAGHICPKGFFKGKHILGVGALLGFSGLYLLFNPHIPTSFFYQAESYGALGQAFGVHLRLICYLMGGFLGVGLLALTPERLFSFSKIGTDTLGIYLCHVPLIKILSLLPLPPFAMVLIGPFSSIWIIYLLGKIFQWRGQLYAIYEK